MLTKGLCVCGLLWCFYPMFGLLILTAPIHCRGSINEKIMQNVSKSVPKGEYIFLKFSVLGELHVSAFFGSPLHFLHSLKDQTQNGFC